MATIASNLFVGERWQLSRDIRLGGGTAGNRRHYQHCVAISNRRVAAQVVTDVFVVYVDINETAERLLFVVKMPAQLCVGQRQTVQSFSRGSCFNLNTRTAAGKLAKRRGNTNRYWHCKFLSNCSTKEYWVSMRG
jgi:hypothetical protein